jgi:hypothetical protein
MQTHDSDAQQPYRVIGSLTSCQYKTVCPIGVNVRSVPPFHHSS